MTKLMLMRLMLMLLMLMLMLMLLMLMLLIAFAAAALWGGRRQRPRAAPGPPQRARAHQGAPQHRRGPAAAVPGGLRRVPEAHQKILDARPHLRALFGRQQISSGFFGTISRKKNSLFIFFFFSLFCHHWMDGPRLTNENKK
jgi:hypothetical protein